MGKVLIIKNSDFSTNAIGLWYEAENLTFNSDNDGIDTGKYLTDPDIFPEYLIAIKCTMLRTPTKSTQAIINNMEVEPWNGITLGINVQRGTPMLSTMAGFKDIDTTMYIYYKYKNGVFSQKVGDGEWEGTTNTVVNKDHTIKIGYDASTAGRYLSDVKINKIIITTETDVIPQL